MCYFRERCKLLGPDELLQRSLLAELDYAWHTARRPLCVTDHSLQSWKDSMLAQQPLLDHRDIVHLVATGRCFPFRVYTTATTIGAVVSAASSRKGNAGLYHLNTVE